MKVLFFLNILLWFCSSVSAKAQPDKPYLNEVKKQSINESAVERLSPYSNDSGSGDVASFTSDFQDVIGTLQASYMRRLDTIMFDNCCQPKFLGMGGLSPPIFPMRGGSSSMSYAKCDMNAEGGGWMIILRRTNRPGRYQPYWTTDRLYKNGFGKLLKRDYWMGLTHMHHFTSQPGGTELRVELMLNGTKYVARYDDFFVDSKNVKFTLRVGGYREDKSNISDSLSHSSGFNFTTLFSESVQNARQDVLNQTLGYTGYCTILYGPWWHGTSGNETCTLVAPNKLYYDVVVHYGYLLLLPRYYMWVVNGEKIGFDSLEMKIRPKTWECGADRYMYTDQVIRRAFLSHHDPNFNPFNV